MSFLLKFHYCQLNFILLLEVPSKMSLHHPGKASNNSQGEGPPKAQFLKGKWGVEQKLPDE